MLEDNLDGYWDGGFTQTPFKRKTYADARRESKYAGRQMPKACTGLRVEWSVLLDKPGGLARRIGLGDYAGRQMPLPKIQNFQNIYDKQQVRYQAELEKSAIETQKQTVEIQQEALNHFEELEKDVARLLDGVELHGKAGYVDWLK